MAHVLYENQVNYFFIQRYYKGQMVILKIFMRYVHGKGSI